VRTPFLSSPQHCSQLARTLSFYVAIPGGVLVRATKPRRPFIPFFPRSSLRQGDFGSKPRRFLRSRKNFLHPPSGEGVAKGDFSFAKRRTACSITFPLGPPSPLFSFPRLLGGTFSFGIASFSFFLTQNILGLVFSNGLAPRMTFFNSLPPGSLRSTSGCPFRDARDIFFQLIFFCTLSRLRGTPFAYV